jgi:hypothetical protein
MDPIKIEQSPPSGGTPMALVEPLVAITCACIDRGVLQYFCGNASNSQAQLTHSAVEVCLKTSSTASFADVEAALRQHLKASALPYADGPLPLAAFAENALLAANLTSVFIVDTCSSGYQHNEPVLPWQQLLSVFCYQLNEDASGEEEDEEEDGSQGLFGLLRFPARSRSLRAPTPVQASAIETGRFLA